MSFLLVGAARAGEPSPAPAVAAEAWLLMDHASGQVLAAHAADKPVAPASLTKLMSPYLRFEQLEAGTLRAEERVRISPRAAAMNGARLQLSAGAEVALADLAAGNTLQRTFDRLQRWLR